MTAYRFTSEDAGMTELPNLPGGPLAEARDCANGGRIAVGCAYDADDNRLPVRGVDGVPASLGVFAGGDEGEGCAVSSDGTVCVGHAEGQLGGSHVRMPLRWENGNLSYVADPPPGIGLPSEPSPGETLHPLRDWGHIQLPIPGPGAQPPEYPDPPCLMPFDLDHEVGFADLLELLAAWGNENDHARDVAPEGGDGLIDFLDLLAVLAVSGPCA